MHINRIEQSASNKDEILELLRKVQTLSITPEEALLKLQTSPFVDLDYAKVDLHRGLRQGIGEVIYGQNKTPEQIVGIVSAMRDKGLKNILVTRIAGQTADLLVNAGVELEYHPIPRLGIAVKDDSRPRVGSIVVASAGTSDMSVCEEAALTAETLGNAVTRVYDVGVAGLNRLFDKLDVLLSAKVVIVVAGMEGALASVIGGLIGAPVIAVPTSVGYGANFGGLSALLSMLNSCASGVSVVNIDNGFGAGYIANSINKIGL
ncbi:MAG: nickel pincer cofactor biosynthesis protein LarB [Clostridiales bacterium]|jgi:NCAIR mutase (PurE)-related protein|nr:nickel pincer cofactor biosynthesis protein LarB [Clostridiales bacterium]